MSFMFFMVKKIKWDDSDFGNVMRKIVSHAPKLEISATF